MKTIKSGLVLVALAMSVAVSGAFAQAPAPSAPANHAAMAEKMQKRMQERMEKHRAMMHDQLKITADQEGAWKVFVESTAQHMQKMMGERRAHQANETLSAPAILEKQLERSKEHMIVMQKQLDALKTFYAVLTPEQQKTFDTIHKRMHHRAKMMRHMGGMEHGRRGGHHDMDQNMPKK